MKRSKRIKTVHLNYHLINVRLESNRRSGVQAYSDIVMEAYKSRKPVKVRGEHYGLIRQLFPSSSSQGLHGNFARFTKIDEESWLNLENMEIEPHEVPKEKFPNCVDISFFFYPELHRFAVPKNSKMSVRTICSMIQEILSKAIYDDESISAFVEQSDDVFERIFEAKSLKYLRVEVEPTNGDTTKDAQDFIDGELKDSGTSKAIIEVKAPKGGRLKITGTLLKGFLLVAQSYGNAKAKIRNDAGRSEEINTLAHPRIMPVEVTDVDQAETMVYDKTKELFRSDRK